VFGRFRAFIRKSMAARFGLTLLVIVATGYSLFRLGRHFYAGHQVHAARIALDEGRVADARSLLLVSLQLRPDDPEVHFLLARAARRGGDFNEAQERLLQAKRLGAVPEEVKLERLLQDVQRGDMGAAESQLWAYVEKDHPDLIDILEALARGYLATFRLDLATTALDRLLERQPKNGPAWIMRGNARYHMRGYSEAADNYRRGVELVPDDRQGRLWLAECLVENAKPAEALEHFDYLEAQAAGDLTVALGRANCLLDLDRIDEAGELLDRALREAPDNTTAMALRGKLALRRLELATAERWLRKAVELNPGDRDAVYNLSLCLRQQSDKQKKLEAAKWFDHFKLIESEQARVATLTSQIMASPHAPAPRCEVGEVFLKIGNEKEGLRWLNSALQQDPHHQATHRVLRDYFRAKGQLDRAEPHERALTKS
jgi:tetratricopeptide (TPR) repeat protein